MINETFPICLNPQMTELTTWKLTLHNSFKQFIKLWLTVTNVPIASDTNTIQNVIKKVLLIKNLFIFYLCSFIFEQTRISLLLIAKRVHILMICLWSCLMMHLQNLTCAFAT